MAGRRCTGRTASSSATRRRPGRALPDERARVAAVRRGARCGWSNGSTPRSGQPEAFDLVDVGAGRGELLTALHALLPDDLAARGSGSPRSRWRRGRPGWTRRSRWRPDVPDGLVGLLVATEWLDNVPLDVADTGRRRPAAQGAGRPGHRGRDAGRPDRPGRPVLASALVAAARAGSRSAGPGTPPGPTRCSRCGAAARSRSTTGICARTGPCSARSPGSGAAGRCHRCRTAAATSRRTWRWTRWRPRPAPPYRIGPPAGGAESARGRRRPAAAGSGPQRPGRISAARWPRRAPRPS